MPKTRSVLIFSAMFLLGVIAYLAAVHFLGFMADPTNEKKPAVEVVASNSTPDSMTYTFQPTLCDIAEYDNRIAFILCGKTGKWKGEKIVTGSHPAPIPLDRDILILDPPRILEYCDGDIQLSFWGSGQFVTAGRARARMESAIRNDEWVTITLEHESYSSLVCKTIRFSKEKP